MANKKVSELPLISSIADDDRILINHLNSTSTVNYSTIVTNITGLVDTQVSKMDTNYIKKPTGGILGDSLILNNSGQWVPKSTSTVVVSQNTINQGIVVAKGYFKTIDTLVDTTPDTSKYLPVRLTGIKGTRIVTVNYSGLDPKYKSTTNPFFIDNQFVGLQTIAGKMHGHLCKITQHNPIACTFVVQTAVALIGNMDNTVGNLTLIINNVDDNNLDAFNIKSLYVDELAPAKYYVNFKQDLYTGSKTNTSPTKILSMMIIGHGYADARNLMTPFMMYDSGRETYLWHPDVGEGFGATSMGVHMGFFYTCNNGANSLKIANAIFSCIV